MHRSSESAPSQAVRVLYESETYRLTDEGRFRRLARTDVEFPSLMVLESENEAMTSRLRAAAKREPKPLLVDLRPARGRSDAAFENAMRRWRPKFLGGHPRVIAVVSTAVGKMHVERHLAEDGIPVHVFLDLEQAEREARADAE